MEEFYYDDNETYEANFSTWFSMNTQERRLHNEEPYTEQIAKRVFNEMHGRKALNNVEKVQKQVWANLPGFTGHHGVGEAEQEKAPEAANESSSGAAIARRGTRGADVSRRSRKRAHVWIRRRTRGRRARQAAQGVRGVDEFQVQQSTYPSALRAWMRREARCFCTVRCN